MARKSWIGVDLDGVLARYDDWEGAERIGPPVKQMLLRVKRWIREGETVKIFTARVAEGDEAVGYIKDWLKKVGLPALEITNIKDHGMIELWDDKAVTVEKNTGRVLTKGIRL